MTAAQETIKDIQKIISQNIQPNPLELIYFEMKRHNDNFERIMQNIAETSVSYADEYERLRKHCEEYGYRFTPKMVKTR